jgi:hypothetical protein
MLIPTRAARIGRLIESGSETDLALAASMISAESRPGLAPPRARINPIRRLDLWRSSVHPNLPAGLIDGPVMEPAQQNSVVCVGRTASSVFPNVVYFAPRYGYPATGNHATTIPNANDAALL